MACGKDSDELLKSSGTKLQDSLRRSVVEDTHQEGAGDFCSLKVCERRAFSFIFLSKHRSFYGKMMQGNDRG